MLPEESSVFLKSFKEVGGKFLKFQRSDEASNSHAAKRDCSSNVEHMCTSFNNSSTKFNKQFIANSQIGQVKDSRILTVWTTERDVLVDGMNSGTNAHVLYCQRIQPTES